jgi:cyclopropane-fatty-acyl-phospholipid synthase
MEKQIARKLFSKISAGGVQVRYWDGSVENYGPEKPYLHLTIKTPKVLREIAAKASVGIGEAYMRGDLEVEEPLDQLIRFSSENKEAYGKLGNFKGLRAFKSYTRNHRSRQKRQIAHHYDIGNDFYKLWLDESMTYSCAYFKKASDSLEQAQKQKVDHLLRKLQLKKGQTMLDIGSGWGTLAIQAARKYGVKVIGISLSEEQVKYSKEAAKKAGVSKLVSFKLMNYQDMAETGKVFDRVISVGMFEHVGRRNQKEYFKAVNKLLAEDGLSVLHTISCEFEHPSDPWIQKYIFPGGYIPSTRQVIHELPDHDLHLVDYENLRIHYAMTLDEWRKRFQKNRKVVEKMFDEQFCRMWEFYLGVSSGSFRYGELDLSQIVFTKGLNNELPLTRDFLYSPDNSKG